MKKEIEKQKDILEDFHSSEKKPETQKQKKNNEKKKNKKWRTNVTV